MVKRWFSGVLCVALFLTILAPSAAAEEDTYDTTAYTEEETDWLEPDAVSGEEVWSEEEEENTAEEESLSEIEQQEEEWQEPEAAELPESVEWDSDAEPEAALIQEEESEDAYVFWDGLDGDPEDPLYEKMTMLLDGDAVGTLTYSDFTTRRLSNETLRKGIDVSNWQGSINWTKVAASGVEFAFIRAGYRTVGTGRLMEDGRFREYMLGATAAGIKVGVYVFSQAITKAEAIEEAEFLLRMVSGYSFDLPLVFDLEHYPGGRFTNARLSKRQTTDICLAFCHRIEQAGYTSMVYSNPSTLNGDLYPDELGRLWLAHYTTNTSYSGHGYEYWQCTDKGAISGISTAVDLDFWFEPNDGGAGGTAGGAGGGTGYMNPFTDVSESDWFYDSVMSANKNGVVNGVTETTFEPDGTATRGQAVTMLYRMEGSPSFSKTAAFTDLTQDYYRDAVSWATEKGVVNGYSEELFGPDKSISREELVTILYRMTGQPNAAADMSKYGDADKIQSYAKEAFAWAAETGIITGYEDATLRPQGSASRAEVCTILMRYAAYEG